VTPVQVEINGEVREVASGRDAIAAVGPHDELILVHRRSDGAVLQLGGTPISGFVVEVDGGHTGRRTSASRTIPASTVATMLDRFAAGDTGWPGATVWYDETTKAPRARRSPIPAMVAFVITMVVSIVAVMMLRRFVTLPWVCGRDGGDVESVRLVGGDSGTDRCVFTDGTVLDAVDVAGAWWWAEIALSILAVFVLWSLLMRLVLRR
jgi:hypothetical protein